MSQSQQLNRTRRGKPALKDPVADRLPPYAAEAEKAVIGCGLDVMPGASREAMNACEEYGLRGEWFYDLRHRKTWEVMAEIHGAGRDVDVITLQQRLKDRGLLDEVGGIAFLGECQNAAPVASAVGNYLEILEEKFIERRLVAVGTEMRQGVFAVEEGEKTSVRELLARCEREVLRLGEESAAEREQHIREVLRAVVNELEDYHRGHAQMRGIGTGLEYVDKLLCGLGGKNGNYIVLSARPGMGKTSLATQIAMHAALDYVWWDPVIEGGKPVMEPQEDGSERIKCERKVGVPVGIFTLEMAQEALVSRMLFQRAEGDLQRWRTGFATNADVQPLATAAGGLAKAPIYIDDAGRCTVDSLRAKARRMARQYGIKLFVIDYIQLMRSGGRRFREDRVQELSEISGEIQGLGKELQVPFIVLAQMNRDYEKDPNRRPRLSDLKDCGSIEQDADVVGFLYGPKLKAAQEEQYEAAMTAVYGDDWSQYPERVDLLVAKNRYGPSGVAQLLFQKSCTRFRDWVGWLKDHKQKDLAAGERPRERQMPSNADLGLE